jgi:hypothetical protein
LIGELDRRGAASGRKRTEESKLRAILQPDPWHDIGTRQFIGHQHGKFRRANSIPRQQKEFFTPYAPAVLTLGKPIGAILLCRDSFRGWTPITDGLAIADRRRGAAAKAISRQEFAEPPPGIHSASMIHAIGSTAKALSRIPSSFPLPIAIRAAQSDLEAGHTGGLIEGSKDMAELMTELCGGLLTGRDRRWCRNRSSE